MIDETKRAEVIIGDRKVVIETGKYAKSATASVTVRCEDKMLFVHACVSPEPRVGIDFFPLLIDYEERMSAIGRIPGGFNRSEGKASDKAKKTVNDLEEIDPGKTETAAGSAPKPKKKPTGKKKFKAKRKR